MTKFELAEFTEDAEYGAKLSAEICDDNEVVITIDEGKYNYYGDEDNCLCRDLIVNDSHIFGFDVDSFDIEQLQNFINKIKEGNKYAKSVKHNN